MSKQSKYQYEVVLQQHNGNEWDDVESYATNSSYILNREQKQELNLSIREYHLAQPTSRLRKIRRKVSTNQKQS